MYACMYVCMHVCMNVCMYACMSIVFLVLRTKKLFVLLFTLVHIAILVYLNYISTVATNTYIDMDIHLYFNMTTNVWLQGLILSTRAEIWICFFFYLHTYIHTYIYIYIYIIFQSSGETHEWIWRLNSSSSPGKSGSQYHIPRDRKAAQSVSTFSLGILTEQLHFLLPLTAWSHSIDSFHPPFQEHCYPGAPRLEKQHPICFQKIGGHINFKRQP